MATACGFVYTAFVTDLFSRKIVGWQIADHLRAGPASVQGVGKVILDGGLGGDTPVMAG